MRVVWEELEAEMAIEDSLWWVWMDLDVRYGWCNGVFWSCGQYDSASMGWRSGPTCPENVKHRPSRSYESDMTWTDEFESPSWTVSIQWRGWRKALTRRAFVYDTPAKTSKMRVSHSQLSNLPFLSAADVRVEIIGARQTRHDADKNKENLKMIPTRWQGPPNILR